MKLKSLLLRTTILLGSPLVAQQPGSLELMISMTPYATTSSQTTR